MDIVNRLAELAFVGKISPIPSLSDGLPYQHDGKFIFLYDKADTFFLKN
jgi:hypothetical protein